MASVRQDVVAVWFDPATHSLWTQFGEERITGLRQISQRLATDGWRIVSTMPVSWAPAPAPDTSRQVVTELALFIAKD
jgi:hypothetical protein